MAVQSNAAPVIIKRKKVVQGDGHHGGAWKVAYADFVTAMMAFFMLMWLLNATTEKQRKGLADYFNPTIPINRISGGGQGAFGGDSIFSEDVFTQSGTGASVSRPTNENQARGINRIVEQDGLGGDGADEALKKVEKALIARGGESMTMQRALRHVVTRVTDEGLVIELFDLPDAALFKADTAEPEPILSDIAALLTEVMALSSNEVAVQGHVKNYPIVLIRNPVWDLSAERAQTMRKRLEATGFPAARVQRVAGFADRKPVTPNPMAVRNNRIEVILLRRDR
ncbi:MAG: chemotaxis protein MotB [Cereibacter sphaeroides]|uniref:Chemotaxis protein MotB n=1 Tax=Cereibacter sphaeroides TaxID=1063 RepID=A0A2W5S6R4_CERSP|nr:MAG: chemotaxis protein MotB [Cereibacter sphaeroides]